MILLSTPDRAFALAVYDELFIHMNEYACVELTVRGTNTKIMVVSLHDPTELQPIQLASYQQVLTLWQGIVVGYTACWKARGM